MSDEALRMAQAEGAKQAYERFIAPMLDTFDADYLAKLAAVAARPLDDKHRAAITNVSIAIKVIQQIRAQMTAAIAHGEIGRRDATRASEMAALSTEKRRWALY